MDGVGPGDLRYLDRLRSSLDGVRGWHEAMEVTGGALLEAVASWPDAGVRLTCDGRTWEFGASGPAERHLYECSLVWGDQERGHLALTCGIRLTESQRRLLLEETAAQLARRLESQELVCQLLQSARLVSLGEMAAGVAHELNQPLSAISTVTGDVRMRLLEGRALEAAELKQVMSDVAGFVERMADTISHLRLFGRDTPEDPAVALDLNDVIQSSLKIIGSQLHNHGIDVSLDLDRDLPRVEGRPFQLEQVFLNLLANARDALNERWPPDLSPKQLSVRTRRIDNPKALVVAEVEDNGVGVAEEHIAHLFDPFYTTKPEDQGTGLGLSISYAIVRNHAGRIECTSQVGRGTRFRLQLPASAPAEDRP